MWLVYFEDQDVQPELFTERSAAIARYRACLENWACHLFMQIESIECEAARQSR